MSDYQRTDWCGELTEANLSQKVTVFGWVNRVRDHGGLIFADLRDRSGIVQVVFNPEDDPELHREAGRLRNEYVLAVKGKVSTRPEGMINEALPSGRIEIRTESMEILNPADVPIFTVGDELTIEEGLRLKYRYLDLRRPVMQQRLAIRHRSIKYIRDFLDERKFIEIETPILTRSTPEGARDYLVPSRVNPGCFYSLPQSPQLFKQLLMVAGFERYYQIARCFRDEDLRADRQPEFTQLDLEMSFVGEKEIMSLIEEMVISLTRQVKGHDIQGPLPVLTYRESMERYGTDSPDTRFGLKIGDVTQVAAASGLEIFRKVVEKEGAVKGLCLPGGAALSRRELDELAGQVTEWGGSGLAWIKVKDGWSGPVARFFSKEQLAQMSESMSAENGDCLFFVADEPKKALVIQGRLRLHLGRSMGMIPEDRFNYVWITDFPLLEYDEEFRRYTAVHHPFTSPHPDDIPLLDSEPDRVRARAYDLILNGQEIGGGSIRIHLSDIQMKMFERLGIDKVEAQEKFGFLLEAFRFGAPPHGGIALGIDRLVAILSGVDSIREVIAFPKTQKAVCPLTGAPSEIMPEQLRELHIKSVPTARPETD